MARYLIKRITTTVIETEAATPDEALANIMKDWVPENYEIFQIGERCEIWEVERNKNSKTKVKEVSQYYEEDLE